MRAALQHLTDAAGWVIEAAGCLLILAAAGTIIFWAGVSLIFLVGDAISEVCICLDNLHDRKATKRAARETARRS